MSEERKFAWTSTRITGFARISSSIKDEPRFSIAVPSSGPAASLEGAKLPSPVIKFLVGLDKKLDMLLAQHSLVMVEREYPIKIDVREISAEGLRFMAVDKISDAAKVEVVLLLRQAPARLVAAKARARKVQEEGRVDQWFMDFAAMRDNDREALVSFVFEEEREHIRRHNKRCG